MNLKNILKVVLSLVLIAIISYTVKLDLIISALKTISLKTAIIICLLYTCGQILSATKWWIIAKNSGIDRKYILTLKSYFMGMFFNSFGLGVLGGDLTRAILLSDGRAQRTGALGTVIADRAHGLAVLAMIGLSSIMVFGSINLSSEWIWILGIFEFAIVLGWFLGPKILLLIVNKSNTLRKKAEEVSASFPKDFKTVLLITFISVLFHSLQISMHWFIVSSMGVSIPWHSLFVTIPFVNIMSSLPISWQGLGVREAGYIFFLSPALLSQEHAVALGAVWILAVTINSAVGGVISWITGDFKLLDQESRLANN